jgi:acyl carrier protein
MMTRAELRTAVLGALGEIAPEADLSRLKPGVPFREQLDIDSVDFLNFVIAVDAATHVAVPEADYGRIGTLDACVDYLEQQLGRSELGTAGGS